MSEPNYIQPHETVHPLPPKLGVDGDRKVQPVVAYLCVYIVSRHFGGREEGGWWYDSHEFTGAAFPFEALQTFEAQVLSDDNRCYEESYQSWHDEETNEYKVWVPVGLPMVTDEPTRVRLQSVREHFIAMFGQPDTNHRFRVRPVDEDFVYLYELDPGARSKEPRPHYC